MNGIEGLITLELPDEALDAALCDLRAELEDFSAWRYIQEAGVAARVLGCLLERRMAGEVRPNLCAAIVLTGVVGRIADYASKCDKMHLSPHDLDLLEARVFVTMSEVGQRRIRNASRIQRAVYTKTS